MNADERLLRIGEVPEVYREYAAVLINNEMWRDALAGIPYDKRLLLLPRTKLPRLWSRRLVGLAVARGRAVVRLVV